MLPYATHMAYYYPPPLYQRQYPLSNEVLTRILTQIANNSIQLLLDCGTANKHFRTLVDTHPHFHRLATHLNLQPPRPTAKKYKTWKSIILKNAGRFCEHCLKIAKNVFVLQHVDVPRTLTYACPKCRKAYASALPDSAFDPDVSPTSFVVTGLEVSGKYFLSYDQVQKCQYTIPNTSPEFRFQPGAYLYRKCDILRQVCALHGGPKRAEMLSRRLREKTRAEREGGGTGGAGGGKAKNVTAAKAKGGDATRTQTAGTAAAGTAPVDPVAPIGAEVLGAYFGQGWEKAGAGQGTI